MLKRLLMNSMLIGISLVVALLLGEVAARIFLHYQEKILQERNQANILTQVDKESLFIPAWPGSFANDANRTLHWWGQVIHTDSLGCRVGTEAPDNSRVILFLGDSMIFGLGLPDSSTIPALLQQDLNRLNPERPTKVVNAGVIGYDFQQYLYQLRRLAPALRPGLVLVGICYNDLLPNEDPFGTVLADRPGVSPNALTRTHSVSTDCDAPLNCFKALLRSTALYQVWRQSGIPTKLRRPKATNAGAVMTAEMNRAPSLVNEFLQTAHELNLPLAFVYFPQYETLGQPSPVVYCRLLEDAGQPVLDMSFSKTLEKDLYFLRESGGRLKPDIHFNLNGSRVVAAEISRWLLENHLLGQPKLDGTTGEKSVATVL
jgi:hypothetical protein